LSANRPAERDSCKTYVFSTDFVLQEMIEYLGRARRSALSIGNLRS